MIGDMVHPLTVREYEVAECIGRGLDTEGIANELDVSVWTAKKHVKSIRLKLGVRSMREIPAALAARGVRE